MCEHAVKGGEHSVALKQKSIIVIAMTAREGERERQVPLKIQRYLCTWVMAAD